VATWGGFREAAPDLAAFGAERLQAAPAYLATVRRGGAPRVHPVSPVVDDAHLFVFMEPNSPKAHDLRVRRTYALHNGVTEGGAAGEFVVFGEGDPVDDRGLRALAVAAAGYDVEPRYVLFELTVVEARSNVFGDLSILPTPHRWAGA